MWWHFERLMKPPAGGEPAGAVVLTASQPFTTALAATPRPGGSSPAGWFRYEWIWDKVTRTTGFQNSRKRPLKRHENVLVFYRRQPKYNHACQGRPSLGRSLTSGPQMTAGKPYVTKRGSRWAGFRSPIPDTKIVNTGERYPTTILRIPSPGRAERGLHPTQKPVALMEYLVRTYTDPGDVVLDPCAGSGTTGVACLRTGRRFIGIELDAGFMKTARRRMRAEKRRIARKRRAPSPPAGDGSITTS